MTNQRAPQIVPSQTYSVPIITPQSKWDEGAIVFPRSEVRRVQQPHPCTNFIGWMDDKETQHGSLWFHLICSVEKPQELPQLQRCTQPSSLEAFRVAECPSSTPYHTTLHPLLPHHSCSHNTKCQDWCHCPHLLWENAEGLLLPLTTYSSMNWRRSLKPCFSAMVFG